MTPQMLLEFHSALPEANNILVNTCNSLWSPMIAISCHYLSEIRVNWNNVSFCFQLISSGFSSDSPLEQPLSLLITLISGAGFICYFSFISYLLSSFDTLFIFCFRPLFLFVSFFIHSKCSFLSSFTCYFST
jgi:hypothetical protein